VLALQLTAVTPAADAGMLCAVITDEPQINIRMGPSSSIYPIVGTLLTGSTAPALGKSPGGDWIQISMQALPITQVGYIRRLCKFLGHIADRSSATYAVPPQLPQLTQHLQHSLTLPPTNTPPPTFTPPPSLLFHLIQRCLVQIPATLSRWQWLLLPLQSWEALASCSLCFAAIVT
jgi:hypothetical protein